MAKHRTLLYKQLRLIADGEGIYNSNASQHTEGNRMNIYTKESLIEELRRIRKMGWIKNARPGNAGGIGNTLEDLLGIEENNLPIPNAVEWELKCQRSASSSLVTLFHMEPSPRALKFVPKVLLSSYGWSHQEAGKRYKSSERSFRQTISGAIRSDRGFTVIVDKTSAKVLISFDSKSVDPRHEEWLKEVARNKNLGELEPQPYWGFEDLEHKAGTKLLNCFFVQAEVKKDENQEYYLYSKIMMLKRFDLDGFLQGLNEGYVYVDFDARTGHNHGTKFRLRQDKFPMLYKDIKEID